jgi:toxin FitB
MWRNAPSSESSNPKSDEAVVDWLDAHDHETYLSTISLGEIVKGIELLPAGKRKKEIAAWFQRLERWSENRLLPPTGKVMREWGLLCARHQRNGRRLPNRLPGPPNISVQSLIFNFDAS